MSENKKWKSKLLSSGLPLEYEASKIAVSEDFWIDFDYSYSRKTSEGKKDFSVDVKASSLAPFSEPDEVEIWVNLLIECKYRISNKSNWIFLPDPNRDEFSPVTIGPTVDAVDEFSLCELNKEHIYDFAKGLPVGMKGTEIDTHNNNVYDEEIKRGINQLRYGFPPLFKNNVFTNLFANCPEDNHPFIDSAILLTTADLYLADESADIKDFKEVDKISDVGKKVPFLILHSEGTPDFEDYCKDHFSKLHKKTEGSKEMKKVESKRKEYFEKQEKEYWGFRLPSSRLDDLRNFSSNSKFNQFIVCSYPNFHKLIKLLKEAINKELRDMNKMYNPNQ